MKRNDGVEDRTATLGRVKMEVDDLRSGALNRAHNLSKIVGGNSCGSLYYRRCAL